MMKRILSLVPVLFTTSCSLFGVMTVDEPAYTVVKEDGDYEIRKYDSIVLAETEVVGEMWNSEDKAFNRLFKYITGDNIAAQKIDMTAPVEFENNNEKLPSDLPLVSEETRDGWKMSFVLPEEFTIETAPMPTNPLVTLREVPARTVAIYQFSGRWNASNVEERSGALMSWLESQALKAQSPARFAAFNPPWTLWFLRRNEIHVDVDGVTP